MTKEEQLLGWLGNGKPTGRKLIDLEWKISRKGDFILNMNSLDLVTIVFRFMTLKIIIHLCAL